MSEEEGRKRRREEKEKRKGGREKESSMKQTKAGHNGMEEKIQTAKWKAGERRR